MDVAQSGRLRRQGLSLRAIGEEMGCSYGLFLKTLRNAESGDAANAAD